MVVDSTEAMRALTARCRHNRVFWAFCQRQSWHPERGNSVRVCVCEVWSLRMECHSWFKRQKQLGCVWNAGVTILLAAALGSVMSKWWCFSRLRRDSGVICMLVRVCVRVFVCVGGAWPSTRELSWPSSGATCRPVCVRNEKKKKKRPVCSDVSEALVRSPWS